MAVFKRWITILGFEFPRLRNSAQAGHVAGVWGLTLKADAVGPVTFTIFQNGQQRWAGGIRNGSTAGVYLCEFGGSTTITLSGSMLDANQQEVQQTLLFEFGDSLNVFLKQMKRFHEDGLMDEMKAMKNEAPPLQ